MDYQRELWRLSREYFGSHVDQIAATLKEESRRLYAEGSGIPKEKVAVPKLVFYTGAQREEGGTRTGYESEATERITPEAAALLSKAAELGRRADMESKLYAGDERAITVSYGRNDTTWVSYRGFRFAVDLDSVTPPPQEMWEKNLLPIAKRRLEEIRKVLLR